MSKPTDKRDVWLTDDERKRFAEYCRAEARDYNGLAEQALKLLHGEIMAKPLQMKAAAYAVVARHLENIESQPL